VLSLILGLLAAVVAVMSAISANRSARAAERSNGLQERALSLEARRIRDEATEKEIANVTVGFERSEARFPSIVIRNRGPASAYEIVLGIDGVPFAQSEEIIDGKDPLDVLPPGSTFRYAFLLTALTPVRPRRIVASWKLASGTVGNLQTLVQP
jgi:hypothetical protein